MNLSNLFDEIESHAFASNLNILSGFRIFLLALQDDATLKQLIDALHTSPEQKTKVLERLLALLPANDTPGYMHPYDPAITGYLYVLSCTDDELTRQALPAVLQTPNLFWARRLATHIEASHHQPDESLEGNRK